MFEAKPTTGAPPTINCPQMIDASDKTFRAELFKKVSEEVRAENPHGQGNFDHLIKQRFDSALREIEIVKAAQPLVDALKEAGVKLESYTEIPEIAPPASQAVLDVLIDHLPIEYPNSVRIALVRAVDNFQLARVKESLISLYQTINDDVVKGMLGFCVGKRMVKADIGLLTELVNDPTNSESRFGLIEALYKLTKLEAVSVLVPLLGDDSVVHCVLGVLGKTKQPLLVSEIEPLLDHADSSVRRQAKSAIRKLNKY